MRRISALCWVGLTAALVVGCGGSTSDVEFMPPPAEDAGVDAAVDAKRDVSADAPIDRTSDVVVLPEAEAGSTCVATFLAPQDGAALTEKDDANGDLCKDGFQYNVRVFTDAPNGTSATLTANAKQIGTATVSGGTITFSNVQLDSNGPSTLVALLGGGACKTTIGVTVACAGVPTCTVSKPDHVKLNNVPAASGGDRASAAGSAYQVAVEVGTNIEDGQPVQLSVDSSSVTLIANASSGKATFPGITLAPDGDHTVVATCTSKSGLAGTSAKSTFTVDTAAPDLTVTQPAAGKHFNPSDDVDTGTTGLQFQVCGQTASADAVGAGNFCVAIGSSSPTCADVVATGADGGVDAGGGGTACVNVTCPGGAPFDLNVTLKDASGNPTTTKVAGVSCSSTLPSVQIVSPLGDSTPFSDVSKHLLAATSTQAFKDQNGSQPGAQWTVVACTDRATGTARLYAGSKGGALAALGSSVTLAAAQVADGCPNGLGYVAKFNTTIPESDMGTDGALVTATELRVDVTDQSTTVGSSPTVDLWVDSVAPTVQEYTPSLCGQTFQRATALVTNVQFRATAAAVSSLVVTTGGTPASYPLISYANPVADFGSVTFPLGTSSLAATVTDPAGNSGALRSPCDVIVGTPPLVTWVAPTAGSNLCAQSTSSAGCGKPACIPDGDAAAGWQGMLSVHVTVGGAVATSGTVTFTATSGGVLGNANIDGSGNAVLSGASIPDASSVTISATTTDFPGHGTGTASLTNVAVDTVAPDVIAASPGLTASVKYRRQTTFHLAWPAPADSGSAVAAYDVRVSKSVITAGNFAVAEPVTYTGTPASPTTTDGVDVPNRLIENDYYFAVASCDQVGNQSPIIATGAPTRASFNVAVLTAPVAGSATTSFGYSIDGSTDLDADGYSDLVVGEHNGNKVWIYMGSAAWDPANPPAPSVTISGSDNQFGEAVAVIGDIDDDGLPDVAVASPLSGNGKVFIFKGRAAWPATLSQTDADYVIDTDASYANAGVGTTMAKLGDFNGDGVDDFAVASNAYGGAPGRVSIILGSKQVSGLSTFPSTVTLPTAYGTQALYIDGVDGYLGTSIVGMGPFFSGVGVGNTIAISEPFSGTNKGAVYLFRGQSGTAGTGNIPLASADAKYVGPSGSYVGSSLGLLGPMTTTYRGLGIGNGFGNGFKGDARLALGTPAAGLFTSTVSCTDSAATASFDAFGTVVLGGAFSGTTVTASLIGDPTPDLLFVPQLEAGATAHIYIIDGARVSSLGAALDVATPGKSDLVLPLPANWSNVARFSSLVRDLDGKDAAGVSYGDFAIGEYKESAGRVAVYW